MHYLLSITNIVESKTIVFPNTCTTHSQSRSLRHPIFGKIPEDAFVIGHIGNMGINYSYEYLAAVTELANKNVYFIFIGRQLPEITECLLNISKINKNIICCSDIPHNELAQIYSFLNLGVILYKGVDLNNEYCAPNKLYEYWSFGIPVVAHQLKGLVDVFDKTEQGVLINMSNINEILEVLKKYIANGFSDKYSLIHLFDQQYAISNFLPILNQRINSLIQN